MCAKHKKDEEAIFNEAIKIKSSAERTAFVKSACGDDAALLARVEGLLKVHFEDESFLKSPPGVEGTLDAGPLSEAPGTVIGRYKLLQLIGEGGFGVVYMAEQEEPIRRRVALKIIKLGMDTKQVIARFEAERQALAMMDHPNIARVFDAGATETGRPYFVMELVKGIPITEYCDKNNLDTQQRLELFIDVCKAVQHAHQKGIIHRDIKPSNVMITLHDGRPVPKIIDFGIAKATQHRLTEKTVFTEYRQFIGTPEYMSPEQAEMSGLDVDTRSDIYSLGVLLYELLTGTTPFIAEELRSAAYDEIRRIIREDEPPKPSTRLSTLGDALPEVAKHRNVQPSELCKIVHGDLDWVVMKTLEKDRTRRYETANELAADIQRHLGDEPVVAGPPSTVYRLRKFVRRHRTRVVAGLLVAAALIIGLVLAIVGFIQASRQQDLAEMQHRRAQANFEKARDAVDEMAKIAQEQLVDVSGSQRVRQNIWQKAQIFYRSFLEEESDDPAVREEAGEACLRLAELQLLFQDDANQIKTCNQAINIFEELLAEFPKEPEYRYKLAYALMIMAIARPNNIEEIFRRALETAEELVAEFSIEPRFLNILGEIYHWLGHRLEQEPSPEFGTAGDAYLKAAAIHEKAVALSPDQIVYQVQLGHAYKHVGITLSMTGDLKGAEEAYRKGWFILKKLAEDCPYSSSVTESPQYLFVRQSLPFAEFLADVERFDEAQQILSEALPYAQNLTVRYPNASRFWNDLATVYLLQGIAHLGLGRNDEAVILAQKCSEISLKRLEYSGFWNKFGVALYRAGKWQEAIIVLHKATEMRGNNSFDLFFLAMGYHRLGQTEQSRQWYDQAVKWMEENAPNDDNLNYLRAEAAPLLGVSESEKEVKMEKEK